MRSLPALRFVVAALALAVASGLAGCYAKIGQPSAKLDTAVTAKGQGPHATADDQLLYFGDRFSDVQQVLLRKSMDSDPATPTF